MAGSQVLGQSGALVGGGVVGAPGPGGFGQLGMPPGGMGAGPQAFGQSGMPRGASGFGQPEMTGPHAQPSGGLAAIGFGPQTGPHPQPAFGPGPGGAPVVVDVGKTNGRKATVGAVVAGAIGLLAVVSGLAGAVDGGGGATAIAIVIGCLFLVLPVGLIVRRDKIFRPHRLIFEPAGLRWDDPRGAPWAVPWSELAAVSISKHGAAQVGPESVQDKLVGAASDKVLGERAHVRLDIYPADPSFAVRHPEMAHLWERQGVKNGYRLPLGSNVKFIPVIASAMGRFAPGIYRGVNATEGFMGPELIVTLVT
ncbi:hypothetical protein [Actinophytocola sp. NPDC049390]|uniref:hypothetical protein n=1 Tax=Actinophytocola sp. NPDC049390 TaxID=3363894 RepID=UPI00378DDB7E